MKQPFMILCLVAFVVRANGFSPSSPAPRKAFDKQRSNKQATSASTNGGEVSTWYPDSPPKGNQAAKLAAFAAAIAPLAANAQDIDQGDVIGIGVGLAATVASLVVGFAVGYGTIVE